MYSAVSALLVSVIYLFFVIKLEKLWPEDKAALDDLLILRCILSLVAYLLSAFGKELYCYTVSNLIMIQQKRWEEKYAERVDHNYFFSGGSITSRVSYLRQIRWLTPCVKSIRFCNTQNLSKPETSNEIGLKLFGQNSPQI